MKLSKEQLAHFPESFRVALGLAETTDNSEAPLGHNATLATSPSRTVTRPPPYQSDLENNMDASSGLSGASEDEMGLQTDPDAMDIDEKPGLTTKAAKGRKKTAGSNGQAGRGKKIASGRQGAKAQDGGANGEDRGAATATASSLRQPARSNVGPEQQTDQVSQPAGRTTQQDGAHRASANNSAPRASAPTKTSKK
ncbi:hypothetical protein RhiJN_24888 [Ceratobasidium sp. AG-Ba]|nr:hypothetical protein RhiJN_24888 [Ceratobasidium sp. AG-Ba]